MADKCFVDTNILVYAYDRNAERKHEQARELIEQLWMEGNGVLSTQVLQELCVNLQRKVAKPPSFDDIRLLIQDYLSWPIVVNDGAAVLQALEFEHRYRISFWDALILQAAEKSGAAVLYSEDLAEGQRYHKVRVVNPFRP